MRQRADGEQVIGSVETTTVDDETQKEVGVVEAYLESIQFPTTENGIWAWSNPPSG